MDTSPTQAMVGSLMMSSNGNGDSDKQACVLSILKEIKSYESGTAGDEEAVESLLLLGSQPSDTLDAVDGLLHLNTVENGFGKRHCNGAVLPVVSVSDLGDLLDDVVPSIVSNGGTTLTCSLQSTLTSLGPLPEDLLLGPDLHLSSPTKARQLLRSIEDDACGALLSSSNLLSNAAFLLDSAGDIHRPDRPSTAPSTSSSAHSSPMSRLTRSLDDLHKVSTSSDLLSSFFVKRREESQSGSNDVISERTTDVFGQRLPVVDSPDVPEDGPLRVFVSDVFQSFFIRRHFDAFRAILEENAVRPVPIRPRGVGEALETITLDELHRLLEMNKARKDGFVKCLTLNSYAADASPRTETKIINRDERSSGELTSGIRTRRAENQDIGYVEIDGMSLPSLMIDEVHYVRLVDVLRLLVQHEDGQLCGSLVSANMARLKQSCRRLSLELRHCSLNDKSRLVVVAQSYRHSSCVIMAAFDAPKLIAYERAKLHRRTVAGKRANFDYDAAQIASKRQKLDRSPADSTATDELVLEMDEFDDASTSSALTSPLGVSRPPSASMRIEYPSAPPTPDNCSRTLPLPGREGFDRRKLGSLYAQLKPCTVILARSEPLLLVVCSAAASGAIDKRGPTGYYLNHLFVDPRAQCIRCQICHQFLSVVEFISHFHGHAVANGRLMMMANKKRENPFDVWHAFNNKLRRFRLTDLARTVSPLLCRDRKTAHLRKQQMKALLTVVPPPRPAEKFAAVEPLYRLTVNFAPPADAPKNDEERRAFCSKYGVSEWIVGSRDPLKERALAELYGKAMK